jgi:hypothetical protein
MKSGLSGCGASWGVQGVAELETAAIRGFAAPHHYMVNTVEVTLL